MPPRDDLLVEEDGSVLTVRLNRPSKLNAINQNIESGLAAAVDRFEAFSDLRVLLITGVGRYFSSGYDLSYRVDEHPSRPGISQRRRYREVHDLFDRLENVPKPVVVAAQGSCLGGALEMALSADFRLAVESAEFGFPEVPLGVIPGSGGVSRTTRLVGPGWAKWLALAARKVDAAKALQIGLIHAVYPPEEFDINVRGFVEDLAMLPVEAVGAAKIAIDLCVNLDRSSAREVERLANAPLMTSPDHHSRVELAKGEIGKDGLWGASTESQEP